MEKNSQQENNFKSKQKNGKCISSIVGKYSFINTEIEEEIVTNVEKKLEKLVINAEK